MLIYMCTEKKNELGMNTTPRNEFKILHRWQSMEKSNNHPGFRPETLSWLRGQGGERVIVITPFLYFFLSEKV